MATGRIPGTSGSPLTAKGDIFAYSTTAARLPVGADGTTLVANSASATGIAWAGPTFAAGKNKVINGDFGIWQRGTSFIGTAYNYCADRWLEYRSGFTAGMTVSQSTSVPSNFKYALKIQRDSTNTSTADLIVRQALESASSIPLAGQTVVFSFYAKAGANYSSASSVLVSRIYTGTGTDQAANNMTGWTGVITTSQNNTLTTSYQRFTMILAIPANVTQIGLEITYIPVGTAGADDAAYVTGVQLEVGSVATPFTTATGNLQGELTACQRYFYAVLADGINNGAAPVSQFGIATGTGTAQFTIPTTVTMRTAPSFSASSQTGFRVYDAVNLASGVTALALSSAGSQPNAIIITASAPTLTQYRPYYLIPGASVTNYLYMSAEL